MLTQSTIKMAIEALKRMRDSFDGYRMAYTDVTGKIAAIDLAIAELQADAGGWLPLADGIYHWSQQERIEINGAELNTMVRPLETVYDSLGGQHQRLLGFESVVVKLPNGYALCRYQPVAPQAGGDVAGGLPMPYSHRNGESEPPTEGIVYWARGYGKWKYGGNGMGRVEIAERVQAVYNDEGKVEWVRLFTRKALQLCFRIEEVELEWYGPECAPWDKQAQPAQEGE